jgi:hypothetical protein
MVVPWQQKMHSLCIGISGAAKTGKADLIEGLKGYLPDFPVIPNGVNNYLLNNKLIQATLGDRQLMKMYIELLIEKKSIERSATKFLANGTTLDYAAFVLASMCNRLPDQQLKIMDYAISCAIHAAETYDVIFVMPHRGDTQMPAFDAVVQMLLEKSVEDAYPIVAAHQIKSEDLEDRIIECMGVIDAVIDVKAKVYSAETQCPPPGTTRRVQ